MHYKLFLLHSDYEDIDALMLPFQEYNGVTGFEYLSDIDITENIKNDYKTSKYSNGKSIEQFLENWDGRPIVTKENINLKDCRYGYHLINENGKYVKSIKATNLNGIWDWYEVGGRWNNDLKTISGGFVYSCRIKHIDMEHLKENTSYSIIYNGILKQRETFGYDGVDHEYEQSEWDDIVINILKSADRNTVLTVIDYHC